MYHKLVKRMTGFGLRMAYYVHNFLEPDWGQTISWPIEFQFPVIDGKALSLSQMVVSQSSLL